MESNLADLLTGAGREEPDKTALSEAESGRRITWRDLDDAADRVAHGLYASGLVAGVRVVLSLGNSIEAVAAYLGTLRAGMVAVPLDLHLTSDELARVLVDTGARLVVAGRGSVDRVRTAVAAARDATPAPTPAAVVVVGAPTRGGERGWEELTREGGARVPLRPDADALATLLHTSGSSGPPRAAMLSHRALLANVAQVAAVAQPMVHGRDVVLGALPLHHSYGIAAVLGQVLRHQARLVLTAPLDAEEILDLVEDEAVTVAPVAPGDVAAWLAVPALEERLGPLRLVLSGSAALAPGVAAEFVRRTGLAVHQGYGLTECGPVVTSTLVREAQRDDRTADGASRGEDGVGRPLPGVAMRLADDRGEPPAEGDPGQILVRGPQLFSGYWPDGSDGPGPDGWWATGDVGLLDADGDLHLVDRARDVVVVSGFPVFPTEVEEVVAEVPGVTSVAVVGVDDEQTGSAVVAFVAVDHDRPATGSDVASPHRAWEEQVRRHCAQRLARFKVPSRVHVLDELPRTPTGKIQRGRLRVAAGARPDPLTEPLVVDPHPEPRS